jgi:hypothetical protein
MRPYRKTKSQKRAGGVVQGIGPEFISQYCKIKKTLMRLGRLKPPGWRRKGLQRAWRAGGWPRLEAGQVVLHSWGSGQLLPGCLVFLKRSWEYRCVCENILILGVRS